MSRRTRDALTYALAALIIIGAVVLIGATY